ncbi:GMC family oxidoreductase N-terminal domain-containing protein [Pseudomonas sp. dw_358]|uniref:GMC family oxidoreductase n=1 Tax=Pseudomonas sp. dw_358 TaxID=2720083 RepID=UPI001BD33DC4|nr:GMC family oxidoreductase N-terminal domain-containing protein [Pseudomonas sp. dw_358]
MYSSLEHLKPDREILSESIRPQYDFIVCGGGAAGCVVARRLAEDPDVTVLLLEAGGSDRVPQVLDSTQWMWNIGTSRDWCYKAQPSASLNGRTPPLPMGKVLGGGSSINGSIWARGHKHDFDLWADVSGDAAWNYESVLAIYRQIEDWHGPADPLRRGTGGLLNILQPDNPVPLVPALIEAASALGIPYVEDINGAAMEGNGGCGLPSVLVQDGNQRVSMAATYLHPYLGRPNLDVLLCAEVDRLILEGKRAVGVAFTRRGQRYQVRAGSEVILSLGAMNTPKVLMLSGIGDEAELQRHGIPVVQHLPGVGKNFQDHILLAGCVWEYIVPEPPRNNAAEFIFYAKSDASLKTPDLMPVLEECPFASEVTATQYDLPVSTASAWTLAPGLARPDSRGQVRLASANPADAPLIDANFLSTDSDMRAMLRCVEMCRDIGNSAGLAPFRKREVMPGNLRGADMENFIRNAAGTYFHESCTAPMGRDEQSVVDAHLKVYGIDGLRIADASIMPQITTGNTMAPTVIIGERAGQILRSAYGLTTEDLRSTPARTGVST